MTSKDQEVVKKSKWKSLLPIAMLIIGVALGSSMTKGVDFFADLFQNTEIAANSSLPNDLSYKEIEEVYDSLRKNYDGELSLEKLQDGMKRGLVEATGDPYTNYFTAEESEEFNGEVNGTFVGIGAELAKENGVITIVTPLRGYPAERAGLMARDVIVKIDDQDATGLTVSEAVDKIRGEEGTTVKLTVFRNEETIDYTITREVISIPSVTSEVKDGIGIMTITRFGEDTSSLAREAAESFVSQNVKGVVVDLRNNPGGYLNQAVDVASLWAPKEAAVVEERRDGQSIRIDRATGNPILENMPTRVLINGGSASASEILAGALKDLGYAKLVGEKSYGKGSVQQLDNFGNGTALKVTVAKWFTPAGINISNEGIAPDTEVKLTEEDLKTQNDTQKNAAIAELTV